MAFAKRYSVPFTTTSGGAATVYTGSGVNGRLLSVVYEWVDGATGADFTITTKTTGVALLTITNAGTASVTWQPRVGVHPVANTGAGTPLTFDGTNGVVEPQWIADEEIKVVVAQGGNVTSGTLHFLVG
jgi:hypothetical protein